MSVKPTSFRFTDDTKKKLEYICKQDKKKGVTEISDLIEKRFEQLLTEQLQSIITGENKNIVEELVYLVENQFISKEYFLYSLSIPPKIRNLVLEKLS